MKLKNNEIKFSSDTCELSFDTLTGLGAHTQSSHKQMMYKCDMCDFQDNSLSTISQHEKQINNTENPCNMPSLKFLETNMIASKSKTPKITQGNQKHEPNETHIQDKFYVMNKDMPEGEGFFEDNNMFSITNTLKSHEDNIDTDNNSRKNIENYQLHGSYTKKDHNSNGNVHGLNTILKQMTKQGPYNKKGKFV